MSLVNNTVPGTTRHTQTTDIYGGLEDTPASGLDREALLAHLGRKVLHGSRGRDFASSYLTTKNGTRAPRMYRVDSEALGKCEYVQLTTKQYASVLVVDIDLPGDAGGHPVSLNDQVKEKFSQLITHYLGPSWVGINPVNGKCQAIWLIDAVYADKDGQSRAMTLLAAATHDLGQWLGHDSHFSHRFSRSPFYTGDSPTAYRWYRQHHRVYRLADLLAGVRAMTGQEQYSKPRQQFSSGRELINAVKARREDAERFKALSKDVEAELAGQFDQYDPELIQGVRVLWIREGRAARDETAFRHALKTGHRLRQAGQRMTDAAIIDAYEHAYTVAQEVGADGRKRELPPMKDRQTMARRVRGYVTTSKGEVYGSSAAAGRATSAERKALATMGRRGGKKAAERWETDPNGEYAQSRRAVMKKTHKRKKIEGVGNRQKVGQFITSYWMETEQLPTWQEIQQETGLSRATVARHISALKELGEYPEI
ncbi:Replicase family protein (plasmid) [Corynebacterium faecale]|uniref:replication initiation protein n=1 Tax=Corynebacterium faecale TaxID=1758466 RepID=UPI0025B2CB3F|nr:replication initiation protein [Corynebacterium faecale]WJY93660.1 Replicase family protein [Corynebacterium faecale]